MNVWKIFNKAMSDLGEFTVGTVGVAAGKAMRKTPKVIEGVAGGLDKTIKTVGKAAKGVKEGAIGKAAGTVTRSVLSDDSAYRRFGGKKWGIEATWKPLVVDGVGQVAREVGDSLAFAGNVLSKETIGNTHVPNPLKIFERSNDNLLGWKLNKRGKLIIGAGALIAGAPGAAKEYVNDRRGNGQSELRPIAPRTPAYADNGGATGDLVFALNNLRHGGMM